MCCGGWFDTAGDEFVFIFDTQTGAVRARLGPLPNVIHDLEVAPDGRRLAAGLGGANGLRVWQVPAEPNEPGPWPLAFEDRDIGGAVYGLAFAAGGRLAATSYDGHVRLYAPDGTRLAKASATGGTRPYGVAFSPDGTRLAVGYPDTTAVDVLDGATLAPRFAAETAGVSSGSLVSVAWADAGTRLVAGGQSGGRGWYMASWPDGGRSAREIWPGSADTVMDLAPLAGGSVAFAGGDPAFGLVADGQRTLLRALPMADLRGKRRSAFTVSPDGTRLRFGLAYADAAPHLFDLRALTLTAAHAAGADLTPPDTTSLPIDGWEDTTSPTLHGAPLALEAYETARSLAVAPGAESFVLGTEWRLRRFAADGVQLWDDARPRRRLGCQPCARWPARRRGLR